MKKLATIVLFGLLFAVPFVTMAAYVDVSYELDISARDGNLITYGYYYMLIDAYAYAQYDFTYDMAKQGVNLDTIDRSAILREGITTTGNVQLNQSIDTGDDRVYFAVFNTAQFNNNAFDYYYALSSTLDVKDSTTYLHAAADTYTAIDGTVNYTIPEPTSGLLVSVGAAPLALKRRRA